MKQLLSGLVLVCIAAFAGLAIVPGLDRHHSMVLGGTTAVLVAAGDDNGGGH